MSEQDSSGTPASNTGVESPMAVLSADPAIPASIENLPTGTPPAEEARIKPSSEADEGLRRVMVRERKNRQEAESRIAQMEIDRQQEVQRFQSEIERREQLLAQYRSQRPEPVQNQPQTVQNPQFKPVDIAKLKETFGDDLADTVAMLEARALHAEQLASKNTGNDEIRRELEAIKQERAYFANQQVAEQDAMAEEAKLANPTLLAWETLPDQHPGKFERAAQLDHILRSTDRAYLSKTYPQRFDYIQRIVEMEMGGSIPTPPIDPLSMFKPGSQTPMSSSDLGASGIVNTTNPLAGKSGLELLNAMAKIPMNQRMKVAQENPRIQTNGVRNG